MFQLAGLLYVLKWLKTDMVCILLWLFSIGTKFILPLLPLSKCRDVKINDYLKKKNLHTKIYSTLYFLKDGGMSVFWRINGSVFQYLFLLVCTKNSHNYTLQFKNCYFDLGLILRNPPYIKWCWLLFSCISDDNKLLLLLLLLLLVL